MPPMKWCKAWNNYGGFGAVLDTMVGISCSGRCSDCTPGNARQNLAR